MMLNVGCGDLRAPPPWVNVDSWPGTAPDVVADVASLPWRDCSVRRIYCGHLLEHVDLADLPAVLGELRRVLRPGGHLCVVGPDYDRALAADPVDDVLLRVIRDGGDRWPGDRHLWLSTETAALAHIRAVFPTAVPVPIAAVPDAWPVPFRVGWQFAVVATREWEDNPMPDQPPDSTPDPSERRELPDRFERAVPPPKETR